MVLRNGEREGIGATNMAHRKANHGALIVQASGATHPGPDRGAWRMGVHWSERDLQLSVRQGQTRVHEQQSPSVRESMRFS